MSSCFDLRWPSGARKHGEGKIGISPSPNIGEAPQSENIYLEQVKLYQPAILLMSEEIESFPVITEF